MTAGCRSPITGPRTCELPRACGGTGELTERGKAIIARTPFGRFGNMAELCGAALFLASDEAAGFVTGVSIPVDGGYLTDNI